MASTINPDISYEVFIHKVDTDMFVSDDQKMDCLNDIQELMKQLLLDYNMQMNLPFYLTSIYDHTIYEALSKVIQKLLPSVGYISTLIDISSATLRLTRPFYLM